MLDSSSDGSSPSRSGAQKDGGYLYFFPNKEFIAQSEVNTYNWSPQHAHDGARSGESTPSLWGNSGSPTPASSPTMSPNSRAQAIAKGQRELMEFVRRMPENCYELSLKDLVEIPPALEGNREWPAVVSPRQEEEEETKREKENRVGKTRRSGFENRGSFLNLFFPVTIRSKKRNSSGKFDERASPVSLPDVLSGNVRDEWWMEGSERFGVGYRSSDRRNNRRINKPWYIGVTRKFCFLPKSVKNMI